jgi:hypothetical protein
MPHDPVRRQNDAWGYCGCPEIVQCSSTCSVLLPDGINNLLLIENSTRTPKFEEIISKQVGDRRSGFPGAREKQAPFKLFDDLVHTPILPSFAHCVPR